MHYFDTTGVLQQSQADGGSIPAACTPGSCCRAIANADLILGGLADEVA